MVHEGLSHTFYCLTSCFQIFLMFFHSLNGNMDMWKWRRLSIKLRILELSFYFIYQYNNVDTSIVLAWWSDQQIFGDVELALTSRSCDYNCNFLLSICVGIEFIKCNLEAIKDESDYDSLVTDFEIIFPSLLSEAQSLNLGLPYHLPHIHLLQTKRQERLAK